MDADGSHAPEELPRLLAGLDDSGPGGAVRVWPLHSLLRPRGGNAYPLWALRLPLTDATGGYRAVRGELIDRLPFDEVASQGYCFQVDSAARAATAGPR